MEQKLRWSISPLTENTKYLKLNITKGENVHIYKYKQTHGLIDTTFLCIQKGISGHIQT